MNNRKETTEQLTEKQCKRIKALARFFGFPIFILFILITFSIHKIFHLPQVATSIEGGIFFTFWGTYMLIGYQKRWRHVYCWYQAANRRVMTPNQCDWNKYRIYAYFLPITFIVFLGIIPLVYGLYRILN